MFEIDIKFDVKEIWSRNVDWIHVVHGRVQR
jgi:hypothetical protein